MKYEEFAVRLSELRKEYEVLNGRPPETMAEFDSFLERKKVGRTKATSLKSLRGLGL